MTPSPPNIVLILADNLGWGELGCYGGGALRGAPTPRIDHLASQGLLLQNFNVESDCVPTRSALMSGRHPIRTGCLQSVPPGLPQGLTRWEITLPQLLSAKGYATAHFGKWHLGDVPGRFPSDRGFDEWYGIPRTSDESQFTSTVGFDPSVVDLPWIMEGRAGAPSTNVKVYDLEARRGIDETLVERSVAFMQKSHARQQPFFLYLPLIHLHFPTLPHPDFAGRTGAGDFADAMVEMDHRVGQVVDAIDELGIAEDTLLIFCSDNGPEFRAPYRGTAGPWRGTYHTAMEGSLRVPCLVRWPGRVTPGRVSNEIVHVPRSPGGTGRDPQLGQRQGSRLREGGRGLPASGHRDLEEAGRADPDAARLTRHGQSGLDPAVPAGRGVAPGPAMRMLALRCSRNHRCDPGRRQSVPRRPRPRRSAPSPRCATLGASPRVRAVHAVRAPCGDPPARRSRAHRRAPRILPGCLGPPTHSRRLPMDMTAPAHALDPAQIATRWLETFEAGGVRLNDGRTVPAELVVLATGGSFAQCRIHSRYLAVQIKAVALNKTPS